LNVLSSTVFLPGLNGASFAGHTNWRLPIISELQSILVGPGVETVGINRTAPPDPASGLNATGQATICAAAPCIDPDFAAIGGPTASSIYWSASSSPSIPSVGWSAVFHSGDAHFNTIKLNSYSVRAVRAGSCSS
jgi:hypothetical protein